MKKSKLFIIILALIIQSGYSIAQLTLGEATFSYAKASALKRSESLAIALTSMSYLGRVGGVAFDKIAAPEAGLVVQTLDLKYDPVKPNGHRFSIAINGLIVDADIYDWELKPIAKYANSDEFACFTLFGELENEELEQSYTKQNGRILNYHKSFQNTLLGLRLFQLDILIAEPAITTELPKNAGNYILGAGEKKPDILANEEGYKHFKSVFDGKKEAYRSYVICDQHREIKFGISNKSFHISGSPYYHFWKYDTDSESFREGIVKKIQDQLTEEVLAKPGDQGLLSLEKWFKDKIIQELNRLTSTDNAKGLYNNIVDELKASKQAGDEAYILSMIEILAELRIANSPKKILNETYLSNSLSSDPLLFRNINPAVWDAGTKTMRYAAFFRYCKKNFPNQWKAFLGNIDAISISPTVITPSVMTLKN